MFRLIRLAFYAFIGYALYEFYQGLMASEGSWTSEGGFEQSREGRITGPGRGMSTTTEDFSGASMPHQVGRGAI